MKILIRAIVSFFVFIVDVVYGNRPYPRFYLLETIARVPYFSFVSVLHLYETLGFWRKADWLKVHFAETWNELHHLLIMESLGGNRYWIDRFVAQHVAFAYYWVVVPIYMLLPKYAYYLMELIENHAYHTYDEYLKSHEAELKAQPAPQIAINYYRDGDLYMFDEFQTVLSESSKILLVWLKLDRISKLRDYPLAEPLLGRIGYRSLKGIFFS
jgi:ubiquinol oxidase